MMLTFVYKLLWGMTVIAIPIKHYSYFMVPYIVAENPDIRANEAITLSRHMMKGHKWECFRIFLSFIPWFLLDYISLGLVSVFYSNAYRTAVYCEYYVKLRKFAKEKMCIRARFRSGESEYRINGNQCRLRDIRDLIMDTGIGVDGYSIIGQGKISDILSNKTDSRREIFEEAAGIVMYRTKTVSYTHLDVYKRQAKRSTSTAGKTGQQLHDELSQMGAELLVETIPHLDAITAEKQNDEESTYAPMISKSEGHIDFSRTPDEIERIIRAFDPWPGSYAYCGDKMMKLWQAEVPGIKTGAANGTVIGTCLLYTSRCV